jgi:hypothetical protein
LGCDAPDQIRGARPGGMSAMTAFEVQSFRNGTWKIEAITDSKDLAVHQAEHVIMRSTVSKVRVVQETVDPASAESKVRVVFVRDKQYKTPGPAVEQPPVAPPVEPAPAAAPPPRHRKPWSRSTIGLSLNFALIVCAGIGIIIAIRYYGGMH